MGSIGQYIFRSTLGAFVLILVSLTATIWITQALRDVDLMTNRGQTILVFVGITSLVIPFLILVIAPIAMVISVGHILNKLSTDSELIVMNAAGMSPWRLFRPFLAVAAVVSVMVFSISAYLGPKSLRILRDWATQVRADLVTNIVQPGRFISLDRGMTFHIRERLPNGQLLGIFVDDRTNPKEQSTFLAEEGEILKNDLGTFLVLKNGSVQRQDQGQRDPAFVVFDRYAFDLSRLAAGNPTRNMSNRERFLWELMRPETAESHSSANPSASMRAEMHDRLLAPFYPLAFVVIAYAYLGAPRTTRQSRGTALASTILGVALLRVIGFASIVASITKPWALVIPYIAIAATLAFGTFAIAKGVVIELPPAAADFLNALNEKIRRRLLPRAAS
ncbi:MAG: LPS export ABC transporter permease LptF [Pseudorhodoplanes sp.]